MKRAALMSLLIVATSFGAAPAFAQSAKKTAKPQSVDEQPAQKLDLDATSITGSRELPTVMNILPWKHAPASELPGAPEDTLNQVLEPVDRVEYRRELRYADPAQAAKEKP
jgi:hypothetical protein